MHVAAWDKYATSELVWDRHGRPKWPAQVVRSSRYDPGTAGCYAFHSPTSDGLKLGMSFNIEKRQAELESASGVPLQLVAVWKADRLEQMRRIERQLHERFHEHRRLGEWFTASAVLPMLASVTLTEE